MDGHRTPGPVCSSPGSRHLSHRFGGARHRSAPVPGATRRLRHAVMAHGPAAGLHAGVLPAPPWRGVATALTLGMATLSATQATVLIMGRVVPDMLLGVVIFYVVVALGIRGAHRILPSGTSRGRGHGLYGPAERATEPPPWLPASTTFARLERGQAWRPPRHRRTRRGQSDQNESAIARSATG